MTSLPVSVRETLAELADEVPAAGADTSAPPRCARTWPSMQPVRTDDRHVYRQHRCGREHHWTGTHICRYCEDTYG